MQLLEDEEWRLELKEREMQEQQEILHEIQMMAATQKNPTKAQIAGKALTEITKDDLQTISFAVGGEAQTDGPLGPCWVQRENQEKIRQRKLEAKRVGHLARALREEERTLLEDWAETVDIEDRKLFESRDKANEEEQRALHLESLKERDLLRPFREAKDDWVRDKLDDRRREFEDAKRAQEDRLILKVAQNKIERARERMHKDPEMVHRRAGLMVAVVSGDAAGVQQLLAAKASPNYRPKRHLSQQEKEEHDSALMMKAKSVDPLYQRLLREADPTFERPRSPDKGSPRPESVALEDLRHLTPLFLAAWMGHSEITKLLLAAKASPDVLSIPSCKRRGWTALTIAVDTGHDDVVRQLLAANASPNFRDSDNWTARTALMFAAEKGNVAVVQQLLAAKASTDLATPVYRLHGMTRGGTTALIEAAWKGHDEVVRHLLAAKASPDQGDCHNLTTLIIAAGLGCTAMVQHLLAAKASPDLHGGGWVSSDGHGELPRTPLESAAANGHNTIVTLLLAANASVDGWDYLRPLVAAAERGQDTVVQQLLAAKACPDQDIRGMTALMRAALCARPTCVATLLKAGADITLEYGEETALAMARRKRVAEDDERQVAEDDDAEERRKQCVQILEQAQEAYERVVMLQVSAGDGELTFHMMSGTVAAQLPCHSELSPQELLQPLLEALTKSDLLSPWSSQRNLRLVLPNGNLMDLSPSAGSVLEQMTFA